MKNIPKTLQDILAGAGPLAVAFSGGLDSRFLLHAARLCGVPVMALHFYGPHIPALESAGARAWAGERGIVMRHLYVDPLKLPPVAAGDKLRCYYCKRAAFSLLKSRAEGLALCDGTNASDLREYRPGLRALEELGVLSPLALAGLTKADIRVLAAKTGLDDPEQRARPCLLTRLAYGLRPDNEMLARLGGAEDALQALLGDFGLPDLNFRLRVDERGGFLLQLAVEALPDGLRAALAECLETHGFAGAEVLVEPVISGYFDRA